MNLSQRLTNFELNVAKQFEESRKNFDRLESTFTSKFNAADEKFSWIDDRFDKIDRRFEQVDQRFEKIDQRFEKIDQRFEKMDRRFDELIELVRSEKILNENRDDKIDTILDMVIHMNKQFSRVDTLESLVAKQDLRISLIEDHVMPSKKF